MSTAKSPYALMLVRESMNELFVIECYSCGWIADFMRGSPSGNVYRATEEDAFIRSQSHVGTVHRQHARFVQVTR